MDVSHGREVISSGPMLPPNCVIGFVVDDNHDDSLPLFGSHLQLIRIRQPEQRLALGRTTSGPQVHISTALRSIRDLSCQSMDEHANLDSGISNHLI